MTPQESILLDTLKVHLPLNTADYTNPALLAYTGLSDEFIKNVTLLFTVPGSVKVDRSISPGHTYNLILAVSPQNNTGGLLEMLGAPLQAGGVIAVCANNTPILKRFASKQIPSLKEVTRHNLSAILYEPAGKFSYRQLRDGGISAIPCIFNKLPNSTVYSPFFVLILQQVDPGVTTTKYVSKNSLPSRLKRVSERLTYKIQNHKINDHLVQSIALYKKVAMATKSTLFVFHFAYKRRILPTIQPLGKSKKHSLFIVMTYLQTGGVERVILNLVKGLDRSIFNIHLITTVDSTNEWHSIFTPHVDSITHIPDIINKQWPLRYRNRYLADLVGVSKPDTLFITNSEAAYKALPAIGELSPTTKVYDLLHTHGTPQDKDAYLRISMPYDNYISRRIVISEYLKRYYYDHYPVDPEKIDIIYNSLDSKTLSFSATRTRTEPTLRDIPENVKIITFIGRLESDKSPLRLTSIARGLKERSLKGHIVVVGDGTLGAEMRQRATVDETLDTHISFFGLSTTPLAQMNQSDFTLLVSNAEGIPMSILESMSVNTPAISSAVGGVPEIITDKKDGLLVDISNRDEKEIVNQFIDAIETALTLTEDAYDSMSNNARKTVDQRFSSMNTLYESLFLTGSIEPKDKAKTQ